MVPKKVNLWCKTDQFCYYTICILYETCGINFNFIDSFNDQHILPISIMVKIYIDDLSYQMMFMSFNINTVGATSASEIACSSETAVITLVLMGFVLINLYLFLCCVLLTIVYLFVIFPLTTVLSVLAVVHVCLCY